MSERLLQSFWWEEVAGPHRLINEVVEAMLECKSVALVIPADLPWRHQMRSSVQSTMEATPGLDSLYIETIDVEDEGGDLPPGDLLLECIALDKDRIHYRAGSETVQEYVARKDILAHKVVWVKGASPEQSEAWVDFCRRWHPSEPEQGLFVIENRDSAGDPTGTLKSIDYSAYVDENCVRLFAWSMLSDNNYSSLSTPWRTYMVSVLTNLCKGDVEVAEALAAELDIIREEPLDSVVALSCSPYFSRRGEGGSDHVLAMARDGRMGDLLLRLWTAQIEVLFPIIEEERINLVDMLSADLSALLDEEPIVQFGKVVEEVRDIELGTIVHLMSKSPDGDRRLSIEDGEVRSRIYLLWKCRNLLAHREVCAPEQVRELLS